MVTCTFIEMRLFVGTDRVSRSLTAHPSQNCKGGSLASIAAIKPAPEGCCKKFCVPYNRTKNHYTHGSHQKCFLYRSCLLPDRKHANDGYSALKSGHNLFVARLGPAQFVGVPASTAAKINE